MKLVVGVGEMAVVSGPQAELVTHALGSCLGLIIYDPVAMVGALLHAMLPASSLNIEKARLKPAMFVDTGVITLLESYFNAGGKKERMIVKAAGCAMPLNAGPMFRIGERNFAMLQMILDKNRLPIAAHDVGGTRSRTMRLEVGSGRVILSSGIKEAEL